jgi:Peptidase A4 family
MTTPTNIATTNWSGAVITAASGESFSTVSAQWMVPNVGQVPIKGVTISDVSEWVGIDGVGSADICQAGVAEIVQTSANGHATIECQAFAEWFPAAGTLIPLSSFQVNPGDKINVAVETTGAGATTATFIFIDQTTHQFYATSLTAPQGTSLQGNSAEFIVETPELINSSNQVIQPFLSDFLYSPIVFQHVSAIYSNGMSASLSSAQSIGMWTNDVPGSDGSYVQEAYGSIWPAFDAVTVTENHYWPYPGVLGQLFGEAAQYYF